MPSRAEISRHQAAGERDRALQEDLGRQVRRAVHDRALARHYFVDHARRLLRQPRQIPLGAITRDEERIPGYPQSRPAAADRRARPRHGPHHDVPRSRRRRFRQGGRTARRGDQRRHRRHSARPRAVARLLWELGRPAHPRHSADEDPAGALSGQGRRAVDRVLQSASCARIRGVQDCIRCRRT